MHRLASARSTAYGVVNQLRDPAIYEENSWVFLLDTVARKGAIGIVEPYIEPYIEDERRPTL